MQVSNLEAQIIQILEEKYKHSIDKDDPLMLSITAQVLVTEHLLDLHKNNLESEFQNFKEDLTVILKNASIDSNESKKNINEHVVKTFLSLSDSYKSHLNVEFLKAGQEYQKAQKMYKYTKIWAIGAAFVTILTCIIIFFLK